MSLFSLIILSLVIGGVLVAIAAARSWYEWKKQVSPLLAAEGVFWLLLGYPGSCMILWGLIFLVVSIWTSGPIAWWIFLTYLCVFCVLPVIFIVGTIRDAFEGKKYWEW